MFSWISILVYQILVVVLFVIVTSMGVKMWFMNITNIKLQDDKKVITEKLDSVQMQLALSKANEQILEISVKTQNKAIAGMKIDLDKAKTRYKIKEKIINRTIFSEREVVKGLNDSEDWNNTKRIVNEIINLKL